MTHRPAPSPELVFAALEARNIAHKTTTHRPVFTVDDGADLKRAIPGAHTKNLFLKDKKGRLLLLSALAETNINLNALSKTLGAARFSFGSAELLFERLGVTPGSVTIFAALNDPEANVALALDQALLAHDQVNFHPLRNDQTTTIAAADLLAFLKSLGRAPAQIAFTPDGASRLIDAGEWGAHFKRDAL